MFRYDQFDYANFIQIVNSCVLRAKEQVEYAVDDTTLSTDYVVLTFLSGVDQTKLNEFGLVFLSVSDREVELVANYGASNRNKQFCRTLSELLRQAGILSVVRNRNP